MSGSTEHIWLVIVGAPLLLGAWFLIFTRWRRGLELLLIYLPFAGAIVLWMSPNPAPLLFKDFLFVLPLYLAFALVNPNDIRSAPIPTAITVLVVCLAVIVLLQMFNPNLPKVMVAAIGAKVWLFYLPLLFIGAAALRHLDDLVRLLRIMVVVTVVPCVVGLVQYVLADTVGYQDAIQMFYGEAAQGATQQFSQFDLGAALYRIPSTFSFVAQYSGFTLSMVGIAYALGRLDPAPTWRLFARGVMVLAIVAGLLSGARAQFVFLPILLVAIYMLDARLSGAAAAIVLVPAFLIGVLWLAGYDIGTVLGGTETLVGSYGKDLALPALGESVQKYPMGLGTGMNTGPARYALGPNELGNILGYESYYAKAVVELGIPGLLIVVALFGAVLVYGTRAHILIRDRRMKSCSAALLAFIGLMIFSCLKGWQIDLDPVNVYLWLFVGILLKLPVLSAQLAPRTAASTLAERLRRGGGSMRWSPRARPRA
jgi:LPXTG-motif cell wall-anchored protein